MSSIEIKPANKFNVETLLVTDNRNGAGFEVWAYPDCVLIQDTQSMNVTSITQNQFDKIYKFVKKHGKLK